jgi:hypothetical protein
LAGRTKGGLVVLVLASRSDHGATLAPPHQQCVAVDAEREREKEGREEEGRGEEKRRRERKAKRGLGVREKKKLCLRLATEKHPEEQLE